jgi:hypothetical protein
MAFPVEFVYFEENLDYGTNEKLLSGIRFRGIKRKGHVGHVGKRAFITH